MNAPPAELTDTVFEFLSYTSRSVFLTGKAGTGKTTFLKRLKSSCLKSMVIVAPTGVAAVNAGGTTIHSFFQLPFNPFLPAGRKGFLPSSNDCHDKGSLIAHLKISEERREIMAGLELLVIDEVSMVRCDVMDAIDVVLRHVRQQPTVPFGGVQLLCVGDLHQLSPVVRGNDWNTLSQLYESPYFFSSQVILTNPPVYIELDKVYRQTDEAFIKILNQVRNNTVDNESYQMLMRRYQASNSAQSSNAITLTTHNVKADVINTRALESLAGNNECFDAIVDGNFPPGSYPAEDKLTLKKGAQVMFLKNDSEKSRRFYNGKIGHVVSLEKEKIVVECKTETGVESIDVTREIWKNIKYSLDQKASRIEEDVVGSFTQFPLRLAWAITIHKSQGLTFENVVIDAQEAFAAGQVYVALSRCKSLEGITLMSSISPGSFKMDPRLVEFISRSKRDAALNSILQPAKKEFEKESLLELFSCKPGFSFAMNLHKVISVAFNAGNAALPWAETLVKEMELLNNFSTRFIDELNRHFESDQSSPELLRERTKKAAAWFIAAFNNTNDIVGRASAFTDNRELARVLTSTTQKFFSWLTTKISLLTACENGFSVEQYMLMKSTPLNKAFAYNAYAGGSRFIPSGIKHPELFLKLKEERDRIAHEKEVAVYMVCRTQSLEDMSNKLPGTLDQIKQITGFGAVKTKQYGKIFIDIIRSYCETNSVQLNQLPVLTKTVRKSRAKKDLTN